MGPLLLWSTSRCCPFQSRVSTCFAALVMVGVSLFFLEYAFLFTSDSSDHLGPRDPRDRSRPQRPQPLLAQPATTAVQDRRREKLAVVVPAHAGDLDKALASLATWPSRCHEATLVDTDLILYYAGGEEDGVAAALPSLAKTGGKCFATTRLILANLSDEVGLAFQS